jgi:YD repeat-containing protein
MTAEVFADSTQTSYDYDVHDNPTTITDANGSVITGTYDLLDRLTRRVIAPGPGVADGSNGGITIERFTYDGLSRLKTALDDTQEFGSGRSSVRLFYDSLSNVILSEQSLTGGGGGTVTAAYDGEGNMLSCTYPGGRKIGCTYDVLDRKKTISDETDPANPAMIASYVYVGRRVAWKDYGNDTLMTYAYDGSFNQPNDFGVRQVVRTTHSDIGGIFDDRTYAWDKVYNKTQRADLRAASTGRRLTHDYLYDAAYRMTQATATDTAAPGGPVTVRDTSYTLDGVHNRLSTGGTVNGSPDPAAGSYTMNAMACDNLGNPLTPADGADRELNQYTTTPLDQRSYDLNGNLTSLKNDVAGNPLTLSVSCRYDYRNRMVEYKDNLTGQRHTYAYDALGRRIAKTLDADGVTGGWPRSYSTWGHDFDRK